MNQEILQRLKEMENDAEKKEIEFLNLSKTAKTTASVKKGFLALSRSCGCLHRSLRRQNNMIASVAKTQEKKTSG